MDVQQPFAYRLIGESCRMRFEPAPVFSISPFLVRIKFIQISAHSLPLYLSSGILLRFRCGGIRSAISLPAYNEQFAARSFREMERTTPYELHLARRMSRLGTETAFEVLNKARALERQG